VRKFYSFFLSVLLILPSIVSFAHHVFEEHKVCTETEIHFHQDEINCSTCFVLNNTENSFTSYTEFNYNLVLIDELVIDSIEYPESNNLRTFNLRAPPVV
tara:strand:+ start:23303 stop:23602 length:300 start_codon:yes stop_codon:yes gene_type:complete